MIVMAKKYVIGIDEVGRGPLAGPVTIAAAAMPGGLRVPGKLKDSKQLPHKQRESWERYIKNHSKIIYATASVYPKTIDRINIAKAANLAATRALKRLLSRHKIVMNKVNILLDGGLYLNIEAPARTIVRGDQKYSCIKLASIIAKVKRDRIMRRRHDDYPKYGFHEHKGYGTKIHTKALKRYGPCPIHRLTFIKNYANINSKGKAQNAK